MSRLPAEEARRRTWSIAGAVLLMAGALVFAKTGRDALFVQQRGLFDLPYAYMGIALLAAPGAAMVLGLMRWVGPRATRVLLPVVVSVVLVGASTVVHPGGGPLMTAFFIFIPLMWGVMFSLAWLLPGEVLEGASRETLAQCYARIGAAGILGGALAGLVVRVLATRVEVSHILWLSALALVGSALVFVFHHARYPAFVDPDPSAGDDRDGPGFMDPRVLAGNRYGLLLLAVAMAAAFVTVLLKFRFFLVAATSGESTQDNLGFFANFYLGLNFLALVLQLWLMPRLQKRVGIGGSLILLPAVLLTGALGILGLAGIAIVAAVRVSEGGLKSSVYRANWEQAYLPIDARERGTVKVLIDGMGVRLGEGLAAVLLAIWLHGSADGGVASLDPRWVTGTLALVAAVWVFLTRRLDRRIVSYVATCDEAQRVAETPYAVSLPDACALTSSMGPSAARRRKKASR